MSKQSGVIGIEKGTPIRGALFSSCGTYRYALWRPQSDEEIALAKLEAGDEWRPTWPDRSPGRIPREDGMSDDLDVIAADLAILVLRLVRRLPSDDVVATAAYDYLRRKHLQGSPLRSAGPPPRRRVPVRLDWEGRDCGLPAVDGDDDRLRWWYLSTEVLVWLGDREQAVEVEATLGACRISEARDRAERIVVALGYEVEAFVLSRPGPDPPPLRPEWMK